MIVQNERNYQLTNDPTLGEFWVGGVPGVRDLMTAELTKRGEFLLFLESDKLKK